MHIVLVDGSRTGLMIVHRMLVNRGDELALFTDGQEALDYIHATPEADVLITSFEIATVSGTELCWEARVLAEEGRPFYVIAMSASDDADHAISVLDAGADDFMSKPPRANELYARLRVAERTLTMQRRMIELATIDPLSGVLNRQAYRLRAEAAFADLSADEPVSMILIDVDHMKHVNDRHGHAAGDAVIRRIGALRTPPDSIFARIGGEEFALLLPFTPIDAALSVADYLRGQIADTAVETEDGAVDVTASFGVAVRLAGDGLDDLYRRADSALYFAKTTGGNRVAQAMATTA